MLPIPHEDNLLPVVFYRPTNPAYSGSSIVGEKPPCVINVHGGTSPRLLYLEMTINISIFRPDSHGITRIKLDQTIFHQPRMGLVSDFNTV
jgi:hypothetical protein